MIKKFTADTLRNLQLFTNITSVQPIECFSAGNYIIFVIPEKTAAKAIGKEGKNIKAIRNTLKKEVKVIETSHSPEKLIQNFVFPLRIRSIQIVGAENEKFAEILFANRNDRRVLLNNQQELLKCLREVVIYYYPDIKEIRIL